jgi:hypothetical protein
MPKSHRLLPNGIIVNNALKFTLIVSKGTMGISTLARGVFSTFLAKRVTCTAGDSVSIHLDGTKGQMGPKNKQLVVWEPGLQALVVRGAI